MNLRHASIATFVLLLILPSVGLTQASADLSEQLFADIADQRLDEFSHIEAAFILSGVTSRDTLQTLVQWYKDLVARIKAFRFDAIDRLSSANKVFNYIRTTLYDKYEERATTMLDIVHERRYNCVSSTILYNMVCQDLGWPTQAFETPTHVYTLFNEFEKDVVVENTHPMGFDIMKNLDIYSRYLAQFYPENQVYKIGLDRLYAHENSRGRVIDNTELLGLLAYNQAYFAMERGDYERAYAMVLVAQDFNRDSRSNVNFEMQLYHKWGKKCFEERRFHDAFEVLADGAYRYPENKALARNARAAMFNTLHVDWQKKNWAQTHRVLQEVRELDILAEADRRQLRGILSNWQKFFQGRDDARGLQQAEEQLRFWLKER